MKHSTRACGEFNRSVQRRSRESFLSKLPSYIRDPAQNASDAEHEKEESEAAGGGRIPAQKRLSV